MRPSQWRGRKSSSLSPSLFLNPCLSGRNTTNKEVIVGISNPVSSTLDSHTFVVIGMIAEVENIWRYAVPELSNAVTTGLPSMLTRLRDSPIVSGVLSWGGPADLGLVARNANNHQMTRGVLLAATSALAGFMKKWGSLRVHFQVFNGDNQVGQWTIGYRPGGHGP